MMWIYLSYKSIQHNNSIVSFVSCLKIMAGIIFKNSHLSR